MKAGDIIQFDYDDFLNIGWRKWLNKLIKRFDGDVNHSALYFGKGYVLEVWSGVGVRKRKLWKQEKYHVLRVRSEFGLKNHRVNLEDYYGKIKNMKYSFSDWVNIATGKVLYKITGRHIKLFKSDGHGFACSRLVNNYYREYYSLDLCKFTKTESPNDFDKSEILYKTE